MVDATAADMFFMSYTHRHIQKFFLVKLNGLLSFFATFIYDLYDKSFISIIQRVSGYVPKYVILTKIYGKEAGTSAKRLNSN